MLFRQNTTREQKDANAKRMSVKRALEKEEKEMKRLKLSTKSELEWISALLLEIAIDVSNKCEQRKSRRETNAKFQANKRSTVREAANILPKRQKYTK